MPYPQLMHGLVLLAGLPSAESSMAPLVIAALLLDSMIIAVWYIVGAAINNNAVKASARTEFYQLAGTAIMIAVLMWALLTFSTLFYSALNGTALMGATAIHSMCTGIESHSGLDMLGSTSGLMVRQSASKPFPGLCLLTDPSNAGSITDSATFKIDYPLAAVGVVMANLTNQTVRNYNAAFLINAYIGFLQTMRPFSNICTAVPEDPACLLPGDITPTATWHIEFVPFAGYDMVYKSLSTYSLMMVTALESFVAQFVGIAVLLNFWPFLLFLGILGRSNPFTRPLGGLVIAVVIGGLMFFPLVFSIEYFALGHGLPSGTEATYGFSAVTAIPQKMDDGTTTNYATNFFVLPNVERMAKAGGCYPTDANGLWGTATVDLVAMSSVGAISTVQTLLGVIKGIGTISPASFDPSLLYSIQYECSPTQVLNTLFGLLNVYGVSGVSAYLLPLLNVFIVLSAVKGLSGLMGGDTSLLGLGRLV